MKIYLINAVLIVVLAGSVACQSKQEKPNILFVMSDDHTTQAVGVYGSRLAPLNPTPTIDALANEGMVFENVFCTKCLLKNNFRFYDGNIV